MKILTFEKRVRLSQLLDELCETVPDAFAASAPNGGRRYSVGYVRAVDGVEYDDDGVGDSVELEVPDDADEKAIRAVVKAHTPHGPPPPAQTVQQRVAEALDDAVAMPAGTVAQLAAKVDQLAELVRQALLS